MTLSDLARLAREATPGPWEWSDGFLWNGTTDKGVLAHGEVVEWPVSQENAAYIAAVSPRAHPRIGGRGEGGDPDAHEVP